MENNILTIVLGIVGIVLLALLAFFLGVTARKKSAEKEIGSAEDEAKKIIGDAILAADSKKRETLQETKVEAELLRTTTEEEAKERRTELQRQERRIQQREESLDKRIDKIDHREDEIRGLVAQAEELQKEAEGLKQGQIDKLQEVSGYTTEQAREVLLNSLESQLTHEKAVRIVTLENAIRSDADEKARDIIAQSIQRMASEYVAEITVSVVPLPNDEMKGRIIGREGRNIRAIETLTGVDLIIDDTPEAITLSSHDPVRREVARMAVERLIQDGRIHPARIEEMVQKAERDVEQKIKKDGERAVIETGIHGLHPEIVALLGRMRYRTSYGQNVLEHSIEVSHIAGLMAEELGADSAVAKRAGLLHDIGKALTHKVEGSHVDIGIEVLKRYGEKQDVIHAVEAHHGDVEATTVAACLVAAADAVSAARPGARRENIENYIKRLEKLEEITNSFEGVESSYAIQAGREIRVMVKPDEITDDEMIIMARDICNKIESDLDYPGQIKVNVIRESRAIWYAK